MDFFYDITGKIEEWNFFLCIPFFGIMFLGSSFGNILMGMTSFAADIGMQAGKN